MFPTFIRAAFVVLLLGASADAAESLAAISTPGNGTLTMCENFLVYENCRSYHHIAVPARIGVGDRFKVSFGSNPKDYDFPAARITKTGDSCTVWSDAAADSGKTNRIDIASCGDAGAAR